MQTQTINIDAIPKIQKTQNNYIHPITAYIRGTKGFVLACFYVLPVSLIKVASMVTSIFRSYTESLTLRLNSLHDKLFAVLIFHNVVEANSISEKNILTFAKNVCRKDVIWNEDDVKWSNEFISQIQDKQFFKAKGLRPLTDKELEKIRDYPIKGAHVEGICVGASLCAIKNLIQEKITNEKELIESLKPFENGFGPFAGALQNLQNPLLKFSYQLEDEDCEEVLEEFNKKALKLKIKDVDNQKNEMLREMSKFKNEICILSRIAALIDLKLKCTIKDYKKASFKGINSNKNIQSKFNKIENGYYQMYLGSCKENAHSIVFIKKNFGSYIFDSNFGLIKCTSQNHGEEVANFINRYSIEGKDLSLRIFQYALQQL